MNKNRRHDLLLNMALFSEVAQMNSFSATAERLQMTPSSISKRIAKLESELGVKLLERTTRSMRLTHTGERFLVHCQNMLDEADTAIEMAKSSQDKLKGNISISAPIAFAKHILQPLVIQFMQQYPDINVQLLCSDSPIDLLRENVDISIEIGHTPSEFLIAKPFICIRQVLCASTEYLSNYPPLSQPQDLLKHKCLYLGESETDNQWQFVNIASDGETSETVTVQGSFVTNHSGIRLQGVKSNLGIGCFPDFVVKKDLLNGELIEVLTDWQLQSKYHGMTWLTYLPNKFQSLRHRTFVQFLLNTH